MNDHADSRPVSMRHVIAALVTNEPGVLANVAGMFAARGFNIDSLVVGRTENPELSRMTIVVSGDNAVLEQVRKQLQKLVPVVKVVDYQEVEFVERDLMLVQVSTRADGEASASEHVRGGKRLSRAGSVPAEGDAASEARSCGSKRQEIITLADLFRAKVVDVAGDRLMIELSGSEDKIEAFIELVKPYGIVELARTGIIAMPRGRSIPPDARPALARGGSAHRAPEQAPDRPSAGDLPPG